MTRRTVIQDHHISYDPEVKVRVFKGEHMILTRLGWRRKVSKGFVEALKIWISENESKAVDLQVGENLVDYSPDLVNSINNHPIARNSSQYGPTPYPPPFFKLISSLFSRTSLKSALTYV